MFHQIWQVHLPALKIVLKKFENAFLRLSDLCNFFILEKSTFQKISSTFRKNIRKLFESN